MHLLQKVALVVWVVVVPRSPPPPPFYLLVNATVTAAGRGEKGRGTEKKGKGGFGVKRPTPSC